MWIWESVVSIREAYASKPKDDGLGRNVFIAWCLLLVASYAILLAGSLPNFPLGGPGDFLVAYSAARIVRDGNGSRIYDLDLQTEVQEDLLAQYGSGLSHGPLPYLHPPFYAALFVPFTFVSARAACYLWMLVSLIMLFACVHALYRGTRPNQQYQFPALFLIVLAFYPVFETLRKGQSSFLLLLLITVVYLALRAGRNPIAGIALGVALIKPQIAFFIAGMLFYKRRWGSLLGFCAAGLLLTAASWFLVGADGLFAYIRLSKEAMRWNGTYHVYPEAMPTLRGMVYQVMRIVGFEGQGWAVSAARAVMLLTPLLVILYLTVRTWRGPWEASSAPFDLRFSQLILASLLVSPYLYWHDLSLLVIAGILLLGHLGRPANATLGYCTLVTIHICAIPVSAFLVGIDLSARIMTLSIICLMGFVIVQSRQATRSRDGGTKTILALNSPKGQDCAG